MSAGLLLHAGKSSTRVGLCGACYTAVFKTQSEEPALPLYEYQCLKCGKKTEKIESVSGPHLNKCPHCGGKVERLQSAPAIQFKGSGWYVTDYAGKSNARESGSSDSASGEKAEKSDKSDKPDKKDSPAKESSAKENTSKETKEKKSANKK
jgi:putative FmdB family regulatory protein